MDTINDTTQSEVALLEHDDDELLMDHVIQDDHELLYLHTYLTETFGKKDEGV